MKLSRTLILFTALIYLSGCSLLLGTSIKALQDEKVRYSKVFDKDVNYCYQKTLDALKKWEAHAFLTREKDCIVATNLSKVFNSCIDTTEAGIFFKEESANSTRIEVASLNHQLGQFVSENLFKYIENPEAPTVPIIHAKPFRLRR